MDKAVCWQCIHDSYLQSIIKERGTHLECSLCGNAQTAAFTVEQLGALIERILRERLCLAREIYGERAEEMGDSLAFFVQEVAGQCFDFEDELVDAVIKAKG
jgi:hypothetical protein